ASQRVQVVLALEVARRPPTAPERDSAAHRSGEERIADELSLKLGIYVSPRTIRKYWPQQPGIRSGRRRSESQHWKPFVGNHARGLFPCYFLVAVTFRFRFLFVFVAREIGSRRILQCNVTAHPTAEWTLQQLRDAIPSDHPYQFLIHD